MVFLNKKGMALTYTLISIVLSLMLLTAGLKALTNVMDKSNDDNKRFVDIFVKDIDNLLNKEYDKGDSGVFSSETFVKSNLVNFRNNELFMFFSQGQSGIELMHTSRDRDKSFLFGRPSDPACSEGKACVCYCNDGPYWTINDGKDIGLDPYKLKLGKTYYCPLAYCKSTESEVVIFSNSRSKAAYDNKYKELIDLMNLQGKRENSKYMPISLDIPLLISSNFESLHDNNPFFSWSHGEDYNLARQDSDIVKELLNDYFWQGGVVMGGSGASTSDKEKNNNFLPGPKISLNLIKEEADDKKVIGVCYELDDCITDGHYMVLEKEAETAQAFEDIITAFKNLESYVEREFVLCMGAAAGDQAKQECISALESSIGNVFKQETENIDLQLSFLGDEYEADSIIALYTKEDSTLSTIDSFNFPFPTPYIQNYGGDEDDEIESSQEIFPKINKDIVEYISPLRTTAGGFILEDEYDSDGGLNKGPTRHLFFYQVPVDGAMLDTFIFAKEKPSITKLEISS